MENNTVLNIIVTYISSLNKLTKLFSNATNSLSYMTKGMYSPAYFQFNSIQFSSIQFSSIQLSSALDNTFTLTYHYSFQFSSVHFSSIQFSSAVLCQREHDALIDLQFHTILNIDLTSILSFNFMTFINVLYVENKKAKRRKTFEEDYHTSYSIDNNNLA